MRSVPAALMGVVLVSSCASHDRLVAVDTRAEHVDHQRLEARGGGGGAGAVEPYALRPTEGYRMPQLHTAPPPVLGTGEVRQALEPTMVCLQVVVGADGNVERSLLLADRPECEAGTAAANRSLVQAAQEAVAAWEFAPAAVCHFPAGSAPRDAGDCEGAERIEPTAVSLLYAFTFEIVKGQQFVRRNGDGGD